MRLKRGYVITELSVISCRNRLVPCGFLQQQLKGRAASQELHQLSNLLREHLPSYISTMRQSILILKCEFEFCAALTSDNKCV